MESKICMNAFCGATTSHEWKTGWELGSGGLADLCYKCGYAYEGLVFCDMFHEAQTGWRECRLCGKNIHCGCIASKSLFEHLDFGGIGCATCAKSAQLPSIQGEILRNGLGTPTMNSSGDLQSPLVENRAVCGSIDEGKLTQFCKIMEATEPNLLPLSQRGDMNGSLAQIKGEDNMHPVQEFHTGSSTPTQPDVGSSYFAKTDNGTNKLEDKDIHESLAQPSLNISLGTPSGTSNFVLPFSGGIVQGSEQSKTPSPFQQGQKSRPILPKPPKTGLAMSSEANKGLAPQMRIARPPADGRGRSQLLPRYWPRITDQELQQLSGDLNSTIVPLFEKVLSASDAGRIGRLVLPKACAEAYFPPISQSEGLPLKIQDVKGNDWTFQFRFWPNNNSRMYVLEGVTPCIQSMQLQAGDTVIFSRIDPGGKLVMGFRKASNTVEMQDAQISALPNGASSGETSFSGSVNGNMSAVNGYSGLFQKLKGSKDPHLSAVFDHLSSVDADTSWHKSENHGGRTNGGPLQQPIPNLEKKKTRNIGSKSKRLLIHSEDVLELKLTWEEAQDLLRPPPCVKPSIVVIGEHEFEEYDEPPVFGKRTIFTAQPSGEQEQWAQCDECFKWRRLPVDVFLPPKWTCADNVWDSSRCSCSVPDEMSPKELDNLFRAGKDLKKRKIVEDPKPAQEYCEPSGLDALASAAALGDNVDNLGESSSIGATTRHPRHRPGCTCIVCIQPPSGKGKHKPTCTCNVCMTVKRRFKTLMLRKRKRQSEQEAEMVQKDLNTHKSETEIDGPSALALLRVNDSPSEENQGRIQAEVGETSTAQIDLNCHPNREDSPLEISGVNMMSLVHSAGLSLDNYMRQNGLACSIREQQGSLGSCLPLQSNGNEERPRPNEESLGSVVWGHRTRGGERYHEPNSD